MNAGPKKHHPRLLYLGERTKTMHLQISTVTPMREDPPLSADSIADALRAQAADRAKATADTGIHFDGDRPYIPAKVLTFAQREADALFTAPSAVESVHAMQLEESNKAAEIAFVIGMEAHGAELPDLTAKQRADCRFAAVYALRSQSPSWNAAAKTAAIEACATWMKDEGGATFRHVPPRLLRALAVHLASVAVTAHFGVLDGSRTWTAGEYLRIAGEGK